MVEDQASPWRLAAHTLPAQDGRRAERAGVSARMATAAALLLVVLLVWLGLHLLKCRNAGLKLGFSQTFSGRRARGL
jgi:hypothetical protein